MSLPLFGKKPNRQRDWHKQVFLLHKQAKVWQFILFLTIHGQYETNSILDTAPGAQFGAWGSVRGPAAQFRAQVLGSGPSCSVRGTGLHSGPRYSVRGSPKSLGTEFQKCSPPPPASSSSSSSSSYYPLLERGLEAF